jgi:hypothetical protein
LRRWPHAQAQTTHVWYKTQISTAENIDRYLIWVDAVVESEIKTSPEVYDARRFGGTCASSTGRDLGRSATG